MGLFSTISNAIGKGVGWIGGKIKRVGEFASGVARRVGEFAAPAANAIGSMIGDNPVGSWIKKAGQGVADFANGTASAVAKGVSDIGGSLSGISNALTKGTTNNGQRGA